MLTLPILSGILYGTNLLARSALIGGTLQSVGQVVASANMVNENAVQLAMLFKIADCPTRSSCLFIWTFQAK